MSVIKRSAKSPSAAQGQVLQYCMDTLPLDYLYVFRKSFPTALKVPKSSAGKSELLRFYSKLLPDGTAELMERICGLRFPVLDPSNLAEQLGKGGRLGPLENELIGSLNFTDFPLPDVGPVFDAALFRIFMRKLQGCRRTYRTCLRMATNEKTRNACRKRLEKCIDNKATAVFNVFIIREIIEALPKPIPWPGPLPIPPGPRPTPPGPWG